MLEPIFLHDSKRQLRILKYTHVFRGDGRKKEHK